MIPLLAVLTGVAIGAAFLAIGFFAFRLSVWLSKRRTLRVKRAAAEPAQAKAALPPLSAVSKPRIAPWCDPRLAARSPAYRDELFAHVFIPAKPLP